MLIYHLSSAPFSGGAARAGFRLHQGLLREPGVESVWLNAGPESSGSDVITLNPSPHKSPLLKRIERRLWARTVQKHFALPSCPVSHPFGWGTVEVLASLPVPDVWNLHWVSQFLDWEAMLPWMAERAPIVWTLHDLNPLRGILHYDLDPEQRLPARLRHELRAIELKRRALARIPGDRLTFVGPSRWMVEECRKSPVTAGYRVEHIPYGLDTEIFTPRSRTPARHIFGIPDDSCVIGFVADHLNDPRKGMQPLLETVKWLARDHPQIHLVTVGQGRIPCGYIQHTHLGPILNDRLLSFFYSACNIFVCPSLQDNLPNTVLEAIACGAPVVAYDTGGLPDMTEDRQTGCLAGKPGDTESLAHALRQMLARVSDCERLRQSCRKTAESRYSLTMQADRYRSLYRSLLE